MSPRPLWKWISPRLLGMFVLGAGMCAGQLTSARYLYVVGCDASVDKLDTAESTKVASYDLLPKLYGKNAPGKNEVYDGCLANGAIFVPAKSAFYTVAPRSAKNAGGEPLRYNLASFSIPQMLRVSDAPIQQSGDVIPALTVTADGLVKAIAPSGAPATSLDLAGFAVSGSVKGNGGMRNQILETSGDAVLLRLFTADRNELKLAVAHRGQRRLAVLQGLPATTALNAHLAPGGKRVLVEEANVSGNTATKTGKAALYDSETGMRLKEFANPQIASMYFLVISPNGKAVYHEGSEYWMGMLGESFATTPVTTPLPPNSPPVFFASQ